MKGMTKWLWALWGAMIVSMILKWHADTYMLVGVIVLPILIVLLDLHEEIAILKEDNKHQRKFVLDRYNILQEKLKDVSSHIEKRMVVDFAEYAKNTTEENFEAMRKPENTSKRKNNLENLSKDQPMDFGEVIEEDEVVEIEDDDFYPEEDYEDF